jgi:ketosteroid isomerase-like protein
MTADDVAVARTFLDVLRTARQTGDRSALFPLLADDVRWSTPQRDVDGVEAARDQLTWIKPPENLDVEYDDPKLSDLGGGHVVSDIHEVYRTKGTGEFAYARDRRIELTIRDGRIARYEMRIVG